jgi:CHASE3 domain sensor protein
MPISQITFVRTTLIAILVGFAALATIVFSTLWLVNQTKTYFGVVTRAHRLSAELANLRNLMLDAETGQRGYLLTGDEAYLTPYDETRTKVAPELDLIHSLLADEPMQKDAFIRLSEIVTNKMSELAQTIALAKTDGHPEKALALVKTDRGLDLMVEAREILAGLIEQANVNIADAFDNQQKNIAGLRFVTASGALVIFAVIGGCFFIVLSYTKQLAETETHVKELNAGLEERVRERTADLGRANDEIQRFAYIVTHDLRAPLVNIMGFTSELEASLAPIQSYIGADDGPLKDQHAKWMD